MMNYRILLTFYFIFVVESKVKNDLNGEEACEDNGFSRSQCADVGCCEWDDGQCWSSVGKDVCITEDNNVNTPIPRPPQPTPPNKPSNPLPPLKDVVWRNPPSGWDGCQKITDVFGVTVCVTEKAWNNDRIECDHIVNVFYQLLDNDADGIPDDSKVLSEMVNGQYLLFVPSNDGNDLEENQDKWPNPWRVSQMSGTFEAYPNSCDVPTNRGASATDRKTWSNFVDTNNIGCTNNRDATTEEILHLITTAAAEVYPDKWAPNFNSEAGAAMQATNGNCGWGYTNNYVDPSENNNGCSGQYAYDDKTCRKECIVVEGIYWAIVSYIGGLYTMERTQDIQYEWLMATPDTTMGILPSGVANAVSLQSGSPALYDLVSDTTSEGHAWLPKIMPDGRYKAFSDLSPIMPPVAVDFSICNSIGNKRQCKNTQNCSWQKKKKCQIALSTMKCSDWGEEKKQCKKNGCKWKGNKKACVGFWS